MEWYEGGDLPLWKILTALEGEYQISRLDLVLAHRLGQCAHAKSINVELYQYEYVPPTIAKDYVLLEPYGWYLPRPPTKSHCTEFYLPIRYPATSSASQFLLLQARSKNLDYIRAQLQYVRLSQPAYYVCRVASCCALYYEVVQRRCDLPNLPTLHKYSYTIYTV